MKAKYIVLLGLFAAVFAACSRDEESLFDKPAALRAQEAVDNAYDVFTSQEAGWEMAYFPNLEASALGVNMVLKFKKDGSVSVTAKNSTTGNKIVTDTASTWAVKIDYGPLLTFDTYNDVFHAWSDPEPDGAGKLGDYEFLILKATPELVLLKGKKHSAYSVMRPMKNPDVVSYFAACEAMNTMLFGNNNIVTLVQGDEKKYLYNGASGQFMSAEYGSALVAEEATYHPVCATEDGIIVSTGFGEDVHDHIFYYDSVKGELQSEAGAVMNAGNLNLLFANYFSDNAYGWTVDTTGVDAVASFLEAVNTLAADAKKRTKIDVWGYGYKQSLNKYEGGYFVSLKFSYVTKNKKGKETTQSVNLIWTVDIEITEEGIAVSNLQAYDAQPDDDKPGATETWTTTIPAVNSLAEMLVGTFKATPSTNLFNATVGMYLDGNTKLAVKGASGVKM